MSALTDANAAVFEANFLVELVGDAIAAANRITAFVADVKSGFQQALATVASIQQTFDNLEKGIISNIDFFLTAPLQLATALQRLIATPARLANKVKDRVQLYKDLYESTLFPATGNGQDAKNQNSEKQLQQTAIISAMAESNLFPENEPDPDKSTGEILGFLTQTDAINSAADLAADYEVVQEFLDQQQKTNETVTLENRFEVSDEVTRLTKKIAAETSKNLVRLSFSLKREKIIEVQQNTNLISLCFDLYGTTSDEQLDFLIQTNSNLTGEILLGIPKGELIKSYA
jgi:hypothetical protein